MQLLGAAAAGASHLRLRKRAVLYKLKGHNHATAGHTREKKAGKQVSNSSTRTKVFYAPGVHHALRRVRTAELSWPAQVAVAGTLGAAVYARAQQKPSASTS